MTTKDKSAKYLVGKRIKSRLTNSITRTTQTIDEWVIWKRDNLELLTASCQQAGATSEDKLQELLKEVELENDPIKSAEVRRLGDEVWLERKEEMEELLGRVQANAYDAKKFLDHLGGDGIGAGGVGTRAYGDGIEAGEDRIRACVARLFYGLFLKAPIRSSPASIQSPPAPI
ncbi:hypothetical protein L5515_004999 [Caenorhabditis briggsae]|uniref:Uncharacterized protein n=1 Tax=Caenorhabditis briggsae TaxID=6238 RepID=A0AAE9ENH1_CAEBR|nr:hypothetical protein L5515_004999 [Caenorhabditis briggsae]